MLVLSLPGVPFGLTLRLTRAKAIRGLVVRPLRSACLIGINTFLSTVVAQPWWTWALPSRASWVGDRLRWQGWLPEAAGAIPRSRRSPKQFSEGRAEWLLLQQQEAEWGEAGRTRKRAWLGDSQGPAMAAKRSIVRALDVLREREGRQKLELGRTRTASKGGATQSQQEPPEASQGDGHDAPWQRGPSGRWKQLLSGISERNRRWRPY